MNTIHFVFCFFRQKWKEFHCKIKRASPLATSGSTGDKIDTTTKTYMQTDKGECTKSQHEEGLRGPLWLAKRGETSLGPIHLVRNEPTLALKPTIGEV